MKLVISLVFLMFLASCAHHRDVRRGANGINRVVVATDDTDEGSQDAIAQANHYCEQFGKSAAFIEEQSAYKGKMSESDYNAAKTAAKVAQVVGGSTYALGGKHESNIGGVVGLAGVATRQAIGNGYKVEMKFKCE